MTPLRKFIFRKIIHLYERSYKYFIKSFEIKKELIKISGGLIYVSIHGSFLISVEVTIVDPRENTCQRIIEWSEPSRKADKEDRLFFICNKWPDAYPELEGCEFDLIFSQNSLHYLSENNRIIAFKRIWEILKPGGIFALNVKSINNWRIEFEKAIKISENRWLCDDGIERTYFNKQKLIKELQESEFLTNVKNCNERKICGYGAHNTEDEWLEIIATR